MSNSELDYISVNGFRSIASLEKVELRSLNILIGANGAGKSNFINVFSFLHEIREGRLQEYVRRSGGASQLLHLGPKKTNEVEISLSFSDQKNGYSLRLVPTADDSLMPIAEHVSFWDRTRGFNRPYNDSLTPQDGGREAGISRRNAGGIADWVRTRFARWRVYHVHDTSSTSPMRKTSVLNDNAFLRPDGSNLASFLYLLQSKYLDSYEVIRSAVRQVAPFFDDFYLRPDPLNEETIRLAWKHRTSDQYFGASALSDGSLRFIALATLFLQPEHLRPSVVLVDEPELGLHPFAINLLAALVKQAATRTQTILSTQSPQLLDNFEPQDVLVANRADDSTQLTRLDEKDLSSWLDEYSLGQLWEKNEIGGRPGSN